MFPLLVFFWVSFGLTKYFTSDYCVQPFTIKWSRMPKTCRCRESAGVPVGVDYFQQPDAWNHRFLFSMCAGESNPTPLAIMEKTRHPTAPAVLTSTASLQQKNSTSCTGTSGDCRGRKWESVPIAFGNAKHKIKQSAFPCVPVVTRLRQRSRAAPLFWPSHRPVSQNMKLLWLPPVEYCFPSGREPISWAPRKTDARWQWRAGGSDNGRFRSSAPSSPAVLGGQSGQPLKGPELSNTCENVEGGGKKKNCFREIGSRAETMNGLQIDYKKLFDDNSSPQDWYFIKSSNFYVELKWWMDFKILKAISLNRTVFSLFSLPLHISSTVVFHSWRYDGFLSYRTFML